jgi:hypothetical protein
MTEIVDLSEARKQKQEKVKQEALKNLPYSYVEYVRVREVQLVHMKKLSEIVDRFEQEVLTFSKNRKLSGPTIDEYLLNKASLEYATEVLRVTDAKIKEHFPFADLPPVSV